MAAWLLWPSVVAWSLNSVSFGDCRGDARSWVFSWDVTVSCFSRCKVFCLARFNYSRGIALLSTADSRSLSSDSLMMWVACSKSFNWLSMSTFFISSKWLVVKSLFATRPLALVEASFTKIWFELQFCLPMSKKSVFLPDEFYKILPTLTLPVMAWISRFFSIVVADCWAAMRFWPFNKGDPPVKVGLLCSSCMLPRMPLILLSLSLRLVRMLSSWWTSPWNVVSDPRFTFWYKVWLFLSVRTIIEPCELTKTES